MGTIGFPAELKKLESLENQSLGFFSFKVMIIDEFDRIVKKDVWSRLLRETPIYLHSTTEHLHARLVYDSFNQAQHPDTCFKVNCNSLFVGSNKKCGFYQNITREPLPI